MKKDNEEGSPFFDWEQFSEGFANEGVWKQALQNGNIGKLPWVENYVQQLISKVMPSESMDTSFASSKLSSSTYNIFETHNLLIVRIKISQKMNPQSIRVFVGNTKLKVKGLTRDEEEQILNLPKSVKMNGSSAVLKDNVMEIRMAKQTVEQFKEIPVRCL